MYSTHWRPERHHGRPRRGHVTVTAWSFASSLVGGKKKKRPEKTLKSNLKKIQSVKKKNFIRKYYTTAVVSMQSLSFVIRILIYSSVSFLTCLKAAMGGGPGGNPGNPGVHIGGCSLWVLDFGDLLCACCFCWRGVVDLSLSSVDDSSLSIWSANKY